MIMVKEEISPNTIKMIQERYRENLFVKIKEVLEKLIDKKSKYNTEQEIGFQNGWNDALEHFLDNELEDIE